MLLLLSEECVCCRNNKTHDNIDIVNQFVAPNACICRGSIVKSQRRHAVTHFNLCPLHVLRFFSKIVRKLTSFLCLPHQILVVYTQTRNKPRRTFLRNIKLNTLKDVNIKLQYIKRMRMLLIHKRKLKLFFIMRNVICR